MTHPIIFAAVMPSNNARPYGSIAGQMGMNVSHTRAADRGDKSTASLVEHRKVGEAQGAARLQQGAARVAQGAQRVAQGAERLRKPPASVLKPKISPANSDLSYLLK